MKNVILALSGLSIAVVLAGCGGGGGDAEPASGTGPATTAEAVTPAAVTTAARYDGSWGGCFPTGAASSRKESLVITQTGPEAASFAYTEVNYAAPGCAGTAGASSSETGTIAFSGTKTIGTETVDKGILTQPGGTQKQVFLATATSLSFGRQADGGGTLDADGYPTTLEDNPLTRQ